MKKMIKSRRGIAIELAVGVMFIFVALSIVLISISGMQTAHKNTDLNDFAMKRDLYEITDYIMDKQTADFNEPYVIKDGDEVIRSYKITKGAENNETTYTVVLPKDGEEETVLVIKVIDGKISSWED